MLDLEYISELFEEAQERVRPSQRGEYAYPLRRLRGGTLEHCGACGLPIWCHNAWGCRTPQPMPAVKPHK